MQASVFLQRLSSAARCLRSSMLRPSNIFQTTASSRISARPLPRSFITHGVGASAAARKMVFTSLRPLVHAAPDTFNVDLLPLLSPSPSPSPSPSSVIITPRPDGVDVHRAGHTAFVPLLWLRDHCTSPAVFDAKTNSRLAPVPLTADDWVARDIAVERNIDGQWLRVAWRDGRKSSYSADWLAATVLPPMQCTPAVCGDFLKELPVIWEAQPLQSSVARMSEGNLPSVSNTALAHPAGMLRACSYLHRFGALFVDELEASESGTRAMIERFGVLRNSMFGSFWTFEANGAMHDLA
jgi:hypothetical protein